MFLFRPLAALLFVLLVHGGAAAQPATEQVRAFITDIGDDAVEVLSARGDTASREQRLREIFRTGFDLPFIGRFVLGRHWQEASEEQRQEYQDAFAQFVVHSYASRLADETVTGFSITNIRALDDRDVLVQTVIERPGGAPPLNYGWRVRDTDAGLKVIDIVVENVSLVVTQRSEFSAVVQRQGLDGLIRALRARVQA